MRKRLITLTLTLFVAVACAGASPAQSGWGPFWTKFRAAVVRGDKGTVLSLSKDPLSNADYRQLFGTRARRNCFARAKAVKDEQGGYSVFCGEQGYYFEKVGGQFKFSGPFAND